MSGTHKPPFLVAVHTYFCWICMFLAGHMRDLFRNRIGKSSKPGYAPIRQDYEDFYTRRMYYRIHDCFNRPIASAPDAWIDVLERTPVDGQRPLKMTGRKLKCLNLSSYNYLGFAAADEYCTPRVQAVLDRCGWGACSSRADAGTTPLHAELETLVAEFVGKEAAITCGMGFATNSLFIPALAGGRGCLVISDALNHSSIVAGARASGAKVKVFQHNDAAHLEAVLRSSIAEGQPRSGRPWRKVLVMVEGVYSMEGEMARLPEIVAVTKRYKAYLYLDEAHSIGALGATGRGVCEAQGVDPADVDVMMGTFTKSFGSCGGYIAGSRETIAYLRACVPAELYATAMSPPSVEMVLSALRLIRGDDGSGRGARKIAQLHGNADYFRSRLLALGFNVLGDYGSPVMPVMMFRPTPMSACSRELLQKGIAVVVVCFPATPLLAARMRICISASHSRADLDFALEVLDEMADRMLLRFNRKSAAITVGIHANAIDDVTKSPTGSAEHTPDKCVATNSPGEEERDEVQPRRQSLRRKAS